MKKREPEQSSETQDDAIGELIPIRTETALSRFPLHQLAKQGDIKIKMTKCNARGKLDTVWEVTNPPGPLAYKLDTALINRRIDEMRRRGEIKQLFKVGSLGEMCRELGIALSGANTNAMKQALRENVGAVITAKLKFTGDDGTERTFEFDTTRYTVIYTGEKLPDGRRADAVYIELHPRYYEMLKCARTRPLDYEYLKVLPPAAQRLYELISFQIFGALKHGRPCAMMLYSELCESMPITRYKEWDRAKKQLYKLHKPHLDSGYLASVDFEATTSTDGRPDWVIRYTPGPKAKREFREFTKTAKERREEAEQSAPRLVSGKTTKPESQNYAIPAVSPDPPLTADIAGSADDAGGGLASRLMAEGVAQDTAWELVRDHRDECERQLEALPARKITSNKAGLLIGAIKGGWSMPAAIEEQKARAEKAAAAEMAKTCQFCRKNYEINKGQRRISSPKTGRPVWKECSHRPEEENKYKDAD